MNHDDPSLILLLTELDVISTFESDANYKAIRSNLSETAQQLKILSQFDQFQNLTKTQALNIFQRNVAFRANRIFNPSRVANFYTILANAFADPENWIIAASNLAYAGFPPTKYIRRGNGDIAWKYAPVVHSQQDIIAVEVDEESVDSEVLVIDLELIVVHILERQLDMKVEEVEKESNSFRSIENAELEPIGNRESPHEWLYSQIMASDLEISIQDAVLAVFRIALYAAISSSHRSKIAIQRLPTKSVPPHLLPFTPPIDALQLVTASVIYNSLNSFPREDIAEHGTQWNIVLPNKR
eukprot:CAMPEP_0182451608 /NCGR_PEP_ID=MMETSP1172-20130603/43809_1 /TAXON_ID=708627 /ORGANISM="Timspurckia oligopyrenoides, Strain CCMP3278" /LENGTH=297 /DNA_ID=CAMNT_0024649391 /DNA_START=1813 /DNA_END=2706 /DNA_ORIENTATION=-